MNFFKFSLVEFHDKKLLSKEEKAYYYGITSSIPLRIKNIDIATVLMIK